MVFQVLYDEVLRAALDLVITRQHVSHRMRSGRFIIHHMRELRELQQLTNAPLFLRTESQQALLEDALADRDQSVLAVKAALAPAPLMVMAGDLCGRHRPNAADLAQVKALHKTRVRVTSASAPRPILAGVVGLGAVFGGLIPEDVFDYLSWGWYGLYRTVIAATTMAMLLYAALSLAPAYLAHRQRSLVDVVATELIDHMAAICARDSNVG